MAVVLACGCMPLFLTDRSVLNPVGPVVARPCSCCGVDAGKKCHGAGAGAVPVTAKHAAFNWADVCPVRAERPLVLVDQAQAA